MRDVIVGIFDHEEASELILVDLFSLKTRNVENVIIKYIISVSSVREGENWITRIIQPKWAIEE